MRTILLGMNKVELKGTKVINSDYEVVHQIMGLFDIEELQTFIDNESDLRADIKQHLKRYDKLYIIHVDDFDHCSISFEGEITLEDNGCIMVDFLNKFDEELLIKVLTK